LIKTDFTYALSTQAAQTARDLASVRAAPLRKATSAVACEVLRFTQDDNCI